MSLLCTVMWVPSVHAVEPQEIYAIRELTVEGLERLHADTVQDLLPRSPPSQFTGAELLEFARRTKNLRLFDQVEVEVIDDRVVVTLRQKRTIAPILHLSTGSTIADTSATLGVIEHNVDGRATRIHAEVSYRERGLNFVAGVEQHPYSPSRWAQEYEVYYTSSSFRFGSDPPAWVRNRAGGVFEVVSPLSYNSRFQYELALLPYFEWSSRTAEMSPESGFHLGWLAEVIYDAYHWDDLAPSGVRLVLELRPGYLFTGDTFRGEIRFKALAALRLRSRTAIVAAGQAAAVNRGDPNHSVLLGSQQGVRGLPDSYYRNAAQAFSSLEVRHAIHLGRRWYLQPVTFVDAAVFQPMNSAGAGSAWTTALATGAGLRVLPTAMVDFLLRVDCSRLVMPEGTWFVQGGISQYF